MGSVDSSRPATMLRCLRAAALLLAVRVVVGTVWGYRDYVPPNFASDFLAGRERLFWTLYGGGYAAAFSIHLVVGPITLLLAGLLHCGPLRRRRLGWHRRLGRVQVALVVGLLAPSGLVMATWAASGPVAAVSLMTLALATAATAILGTRAAIRRRMEAHQRWMTRCTLLLLSAVALRLLGGLGVVLGITAAWYDPAITWAAWVGPLAAYEIRLRMRRRQKSPTGSPRMSF